MRISLAQLNFHVGDIDNNKETILQAIAHARDEQQANVVIFPELALTGYPPEDLLLRTDFLEQTSQAVNEITHASDGIDVVLGYPSLNRGQTDILFNTSGFFSKQMLVSEYYKQCLPNYSVFDEKRYFQAGCKPCVVDINGTSVGLLICEDIWEKLPAEDAVATGAQMLFVINASPYHLGKSEQRDMRLQEQARKFGIPIVYLNLIGGQDELVFDGGSLLVSGDGEIIHRASSFVAQQLIIDTNKKVQPSLKSSLTPIKTVSEVYDALVLGVRDYALKSGFKGAVLGLSGGIDSALTLAIAVDALGADQLEVVMMPSQYTRDMSNKDAAKQAEILGVEYCSIPIEPVFKAFLGMLENEFSDFPKDVTEENIQARCRGILLMAISNKKGKILLTTGNKSEMAVGYATLYGDMAGGFAPLKDVPKTLVYELARFCNREQERIPQRVIDRPPSAELAPDQQDTDSLPDYDTLDAILERYIEGDKGLNEIVADGFELPIVERVIGLVDRNEYKRRQAPPGIKITSRAFGRERRYPITNGFRP